MARDRTWNRSALRAAWFGVLGLGLTLATVAPGCGGYTARPLSGLVILEEMQAASSTAEAASAQVLTEDEAVQLALDAAPELRSGEAAVCAAEAEVLVADAWPDSEVRLNDIGWRKGDDTLERFDVALRVHFPHAFSSSARHRAARAAVPAAQATLDGLSLDVAGKTRLAFVDALVASRRVDIARARVTLAQEREESVATAVDKGVTTPLDIADARIARLEAEQALQTAERRKLDAGRRLARRLGRGDGEPVTPREDAPLQCPAPPADDAVLLRQVGEHHPAVRSAQARYRKAEAALEESYARRIPFLSYLQTAYEYEPSTAESGLRFSLALELPLGAWQGGAVALGEARREMEAAELRQEVASRLDEAREALSRWRDAHERLSGVRETLLPSLERAVSRTDEASTAGSTTELELFAAKERLLRGQAAELAALGDCHAAWRRAEHSAGGASAAK